MGAEEIARRRRAIADLATDLTEGQEPAYLCPTCGRHLPCRHCPEGDAS